jgi:translation initiation factor IF-3
MLIDDESGEKLGTMPMLKALSMAQAKSFDLVEVSPLSKPPVCKIMDFGQYLYQQKKIEKKQKQSQKKKSLKNIRLSARIDQHDIETKAKNARKFLETGNPVKVTLMFRGREMQHSEIGFAKMNDFIELVKDVSKSDKRPLKQGNQIYILLLPLPVKSK